MSHTPTTAAAAARASCVCACASMYQQVAARVEGLSPRASPTTGTQQLPPALLELLADELILKVGVGVLADLERLGRALGVVAQGGVELAGIVTVDGSSQRLATPQQGGEHRVVKLAAEALDLLSDSDDDSHAQPDLSNARGRQPSHRLSAGTIWPLVADRRE